MTVKVTVARIIGVALVIWGSLSFIFSDSSDYFISPSFFIVFTLDTIMPLGIGIYLVARNYSQKPVKTE